MTDVHSPTSHHDVSMRLDESALKCIRSGMDGSKHGSVRSDSYSSVKEDLDGNPQSFLVTSKSRNHEEVLEDDSDSLPDIFSPTVPRIVSLPVRASVGMSLESLPAELLDRILTNLAIDVPPTDFAPRNLDLVACMLTSRRMYRATTAVLYRQVTFPHGRVFSKFLKVVEESSDLGRLARRMDLSHFTSIGLGRTRKDNGATPNFTNVTFRRCLDLMPNLQEILLQHHVDEDADASVIDKLFNFSPQLRAMDLCAMTHQKFVAAFTAAMTGLQPMQNLRNLSLHECCTIPSAELATLMQFLPRLTILDVHHTRIRDDALMAIPKTARLTHLNLGRCPHITGPGMVRFVKEHPASQSLIFLNLGADISRYRLLHDADSDALLPILPSSLRSLNINGAALRTDHMPRLIELTSHLEELSVNFTQLTMDDICSLVGKRKNAPDSTLRYIDVTGVKSVTQTTLFSRGTELLGGDARPLEVIELSPSLATSIQKMKATNTRLGWMVKEAGRRSWYVRADGTAEADPQRAWKMGSRWWGMRKVPVAWSDVGGIYGHYMFKSN